MRSLVIDATFNFGAAMRLIGLSSIAVVVLFACGGGSSGTGSGSSGNSPVPTGTPLPPGAPGTHSITVVIQGQGTVTSNPAGLDCPSKCSAVFADGTHLILSATAASGWQLSSWSGSCSGSSCAIALTNDTAVTATFAQTNAPPDECAGLLPASVPAPVAAKLECNGHCLFGTSDDGAGNFALQRGVNPGAPNNVAYGFYEVRDGTILPRGGTQTWRPDEFFVYAEPSGFTSLITDPSDSALRTYALDAPDNDGGAPDVTYPGKVFAAPDPSGGFATIDRLLQGNGSYTFGFRRYDKNNAPLTPHTTILNGSPGYTVLSTAMTLAHDTLVLFELADENGQSFSGSWVAPDGTPTALFPVSSAGQLQFMLGGGLIQHAGRTFSVWTDGATSPSPAPAWLQDRAQASWMFPIRHGAAYAMGGTCAGVEVLSTSGKSCGCLAVPAVADTTTIGRDGSLIVPRPDGYDLYALLFR